MLHNFIYNNIRPSAGSGKKLCKASHSRTQPQQLPSYLQQYTPPQISEACSRIVHMSKPIHVEVPTCTNLPPQTHTGQSKAKQTLSGTTPSKSISKQNQVASSKGNSIPPVSSKPMPVSSTVNAFPSMFSSSLPSAASVREH